MVTLNLWTFGVQPLAPVTTAKTYAIFTAINLSSLQVPVWENREVQSKKNAVPATVIEEQLQSHWETGKAVVREESEPGDLPEEFHTQT